MKNILTKSLYALSATALLFSCDPKIETPAPSTNGKIDLSNYIAIGNSLTAGYASNGLYLEGQKVGYPVLLAQQFKLAGGGDFNAPLFAADQADGTGYLRLTGFVNGSPILTSVPMSLNIVAGKSDLAYHPRLNPDSVVFKKYDGPKNNNFGVPGIRVADIDVPGYAWKNPYMGRMMADDGEKGTTSYIAKVAAQNPSFFTCWLGNNDVLGYATAGGFEEFGAITDQATFSASYNKLLDQLVFGINPAKGAVANIPDVTSIPFFTTVGPGLKPSLAASGAPAFFEYEFGPSLTATVIGALMNPDTSVKVLNPAMSLPTPVSSIATLNPVTGTFDGDVFFTLTFSSLAAEMGKPNGKAWKAVINNLLDGFTFPNPTFPFTRDQVYNLVWSKSGLDTTQKFGFHPLNPVPDIFVLSSTETANAKAAVVGYNQTIKNAADARGLAYVDANAFLGGITKGAYYDAISTNASFISGGVFSLDGVHLTPRGNALATNEWIKAINAKYGSKITVLNPGQYKGVTFP